jgi:VanZ family protein
MALSSAVLKAHAPRARRYMGVRLQTQLRAWLPVFVCAMLFAAESTSSFGSDYTDALLRHIAEALFGYNVGAHWELIHYLIRKTGHFIAYGMFSLVCFHGFWIALRPPMSRWMRKLRAHGLAILITFLVGSADEFHQSFVPNRFGSFRDVLIDTCGAVTMGLALFLAMRTVENRRQARKRANCRKTACAEVAI